MKIWFDILTPKQLLFFGYMVNRLEKKHDVLCTSRHYREVVELAKIHKFKLDLVGRHGGGDIRAKLDASLKRTMALSKKVQKFDPDVAVSSGSPEAARIAYGLGIPHIGFINATHAEQAIRLSVSRMTKLLTPHNIPKNHFVRYGIDSKNVIQYKAMDEYGIIRNYRADIPLPDIKLDKTKKTILFRTHQSQAAYIDYKENTDDIIDALIKNFSQHNIVVIPRYTEEIRRLKKKYGKHNVIILDKVVDSNAILSVTDVFVGSGGTMTCEAALRNIPSISYEAISYMQEDYLVKKGVLVRAKTPKRIVAETARMLQNGNSGAKNKVDKLVAGMQDPFLTLQNVLAQVK